MQTSHLNNKPTQKFSAGAELIALCWKSALKLRARLGPLKPFRLKSVFSWPFQSFSISVPFVFFLNSLRDNKEVISPHPSKSHTPKGNNNVWCIPFCFSLLIQTYSYMGFRFLSLKMGRYAYIKSFSNLFSPKALS